MIMTDAITGYGSEFHLADEIGVLTEVGGLIALEPGSEEWGTTETTHFKSTQRRRAYLKTLFESGQGNFQVNWLTGSPTANLISDAPHSTDGREFNIVVPATPGTWGITGKVMVK